MLNYQRNKNIFGKLSSNFTIQNFFKIIIIKILQISKFFHKLKSHHPLSSSLNAVVSLILSKFSSTGVEASSIGAEASFTGAEASLPPKAQNTGAEASLPPKAKILHWSEGFQSPSAKKSEGIFLSPEGEFPSFKIFSCGRLEADAP